MNIMEMEEIESKRCIASFGGRCPYNCAHCYTFIDKYETEQIRSISQIVDNLRNKQFNIIYISGQRENFVIPHEGLELCEQLFNVFQTDIMITTRNVFNKDELDRLNQLNKKMKLANKDLFVCSSIPALASYRKIEPSELMPSPYERMEFLKAVHSLGIFSILTIRPLCPESFIPISEPLTLVESCEHTVDAVISSGIVVHESILSKLNGFPAEVNKKRQLIMSCLKRDVYVDYVNVDKELMQIRRYCEQLGLHFEENSLSVVRYLKKVRSATNLGFVSGGMTANLKLSATIEQ
jgi:DNA repair photolyase